MFVWSACISLSVSLIPSRAPWAMLRMFSRLWSIFSADYTGRGGKGVCLPLLLQHQVKLQSDCRTKSTKKCWFLSNIKGIPTNILRNQKTQSTKYLIPTKAIHNIVTSKSVRLFEREKKLWNCIEWFHRHSMCVWKEQEKTFTLEKICYRTKNSEITKKWWGIWFQRFHVWWRNENVRFQRGKQNKSQPTCSMIYPPVQLFMCSVGCWQTVCGWWSYC